MTSTESNGIKKYLTVHAGTLVLAIVVQTVGLVWWASSINTRVKFLERDVEKIDARVRGLEVAKK